MGNGKCLQCGTFYAKGDFCGLLESCLFSMLKTTQWYLETENRKIGIRTYKSA